MTPIAALRERLGSRFPEVDAVFGDCVARAQAALAPAEVLAWIDLAGWLGRLGRGPEPLLVALETLPDVLAQCGADVLPPLRHALAALQKSPDGRAIAPLLQTLPAVARRLPSAELLARYLALVLDLARRTRLSIHGHHATEPSPGLPALLAQAPRLVAQVPLEGLAHWIEAGIHLHGAHPQHQIDYFSLQSADSRALLQRERHGTLLVDAERRLALTLRSLWQLDPALVPYPVHEAAEQSARSADAALLPHKEADGWRLPEVLDDWRGVPALARYRAMAAHLAAHERWSRPLVADNLSPLQRLAVECFEDARVDHLLLRRYPGLAPTLRALHPVPAWQAPDDSEGAGGPDGPDRRNTLRVRLARVSRALLDPGWLEEAAAYVDGDTAMLRDTRQRFLAALGDGEADTRQMAALALAWVVRERRRSDQYAEVVFADTAVDWRDDNRHLWTYIEPGDEEESFDCKRHSAAPNEDRLPPHLYPEWDRQAQAWRPDWVSVYDTLQPSGDAAQIDALLARHDGVARDLRRVLDALKPQDRTRLRRQEEGSELDLDAAVRAVTDLRAGHLPDTRVQMSTRTDGRDIAVLLLLDLSASVNDPVAGAPGETVLSLSRAAVALLAGAVSALGDQLAIAGFHSNTRHEVRYLHLKGFGEPWDDVPKARLAAAEGAYSTRMGAALRHAGHLLGGRKAGKRLLLVLTDGRPADIDVADPEHLTADAAQAVRELDRQGLHTHCISLDAQADDYVSRVFGSAFAVIDRVEQLPRRLVDIFIRLTR